MTDTAIPVSRARAFSMKQLMGTLHLWLGLICGVPAAILGVTGVYLMVTHPLPATVSQDIYTGSVDALVVSARAAAPADATPTQYTAPVRDGEMATVRFTVPRTSSAPRGNLNVEIDPASGAVAVAESGPLSRVMHDLHVNFMAGTTGKWLVGVAGVVMTVLAITGVVIWWPRAGQWLNAFIITGRGGALRFLRELHGATGIWGLIVFAVVSVTGVVIVFPATTAGGPSPPARGAGGPPSGAPTGLDTYRIDAAIALAKESQPGAVVRVVAFPARAGEPYQVRFSPPGEDRFAPQTTVIVDHEVTKVAEVRAPVPVSNTMRSLSRQLHTGRGGGWTWWILVTVSGALPVGFIISGTAMWLIKRRNRARVGA